MATPQLTLDQLITEACELFAPADAPTRYYSSALIHAKAFRRKLITSSSRENATELLEVGNDRTADLPADYVEYARLGVYSEAHQAVYALAYGDAVPAHGRRSLQPQDWPYEWMRQGGFKIDLPGRRIVCNSLVPEGTVLLLEYKRFSAPAGEDIAIDPLAHSYGVQFILTELHRQKQNWTAMQVAATECEKERGLYQEATRNFSLARVNQIRHQAAAQRWK